MYTLRIEPAPSVEEQLSAAIDWEWLPHFVDMSEPVSRAQAEEEVARGRRYGQWDTVDWAEIRRAGGREYLVRVHVNERASSWADIKAIEAPRPEE